jgi:signal transduction histidine kinase
MDPNTKKTLTYHAVVFTLIVTVISFYLYFIEETFYLWLFFVLYTLLTVILHFYYVSIQRVRLAQMIKKEEDMLKQKEEADSKTQYLKSLRKKKILEEQTKAVHALVIAQNHKINSLLNGIIGYCSILSSKIAKTELANKDSIINVVAKIKSSGDSINSMMKDFDNPDNQIIKEIFETKEYLDLEKEYLEKDMAE